jgi:hypothetical protein
MMKFSKGFYVVQLPILTGLAVIPQLSTIATPPPTSCMVDVTDGRNPLGNRNLLNFKQLEDGTTIVTYERLPANITNIRAKATIESQRVLKMYEMPIASVREALLAKPELYDELLGFKPNGGFKAVNALLVCQSKDLSAVPRSPTIASLADGSYSYWNGKPTAPNGTVSNDALLKAGGVLYTFVKKGDQVTGSFGAVDGEAICVKGTAKDNIITGMAFPLDGMGSSQGEVMKSWHPSGVLKVGNWQPGKPEMPGRYARAALTLDGFNRVTIDRQSMPKACVSQN